jgi:CheY-like chemotaxis protein
MNIQRSNLLLADDDEDDRAFFREALDELLIPINLTTVNDGVELMDFLLESNNLPDILFLDLNMPRKSGFECLSEIKKTDRLRQLTIIIFSTSLDTRVVDLMYENGATYYIQKPAEFYKLKKVIENALAICAKNNFKQPERHNFILQP